MEFEEKIKISFFDMKDSVRWIVEKDTASLQQAVAVLRKKKGSRRAQKSATFWQV